MHITIKHTPNNIIDLIHAMVNYYGLQSLWFLVRKISFIIIIAKNLMKAIDF